MILWIFAAIVMGLVSVLFLALHVLVLREPRWLVLLVAFIVVRFWKGKN